MTIVQRFADIPNIRKKRFQAEETITSMFVLNMYDKKVVTNKNWKAAEIFVCVKRYQGSWKLDEMYFKLTDFT